MTPLPPMSFLQPSLFLTVAFYFRIWSKYNTFLKKKSCHITLGLLTERLLPKHASITFHYAISPGYCCFLYVS